MRALPSLHRSVHALLLLTLALVLSAFLFSSSSSRHFLAVMWMGIYIPHVRNPVRFPDVRAQETASFCVHVRAAQDEVFLGSCVPLWRGQSQALTFDCLSRLTGLTDQGLGEDAGGRGWWWLFLVGVILQSRLGPVLISVRLHRPSPARKRSGACVRFRAHADVLKCFPVSTRCGTGPNYRLSRRWHPMRT